ncbi:hypothetical protein LINPERHAP1_LOCUS35855 [Linum perenne]
MKMSLPLGKNNWDKRRRMSGDQCRWCYDTTFFLGGAAGLVARDSSSTVLFPTGTHACVLLCSLHGWSDVNIKWDATLVATNGLKS